MGPAAAEGRAIESWILTRGWAIALGVALLAHALPPTMPPASTRVLLLTRDLALVAAGFVLLALGLRRVRARGASLATLAYPIGGALLFGAMLVSTVVARAAVAAKLEAFAPEVPSQLAFQVEALGKLRFVWIVLAVVAAALGLLTPVRREPPAVDAEPPAGDGEPPAGDAPPPSGTP